MRFAPEYIYSISCPLTGHIVYVGKSKVPFDRFKQHSNSYLHVGTWIRAMRSIKLEPVFNIIDCTYGDIEKLESQYINYYSELGQANFNSYKISKNALKRNLSVNYYIGIEKPDAHPEILRSKEKLAERCSQLLIRDCMYARIPIYTLNEIHRLILTTQKGYKYF